MKTINFNITGRNESHIGTAIEFDFITTGINAAVEHFGFENSNEVKRNMIGTQSADGKNYKIFENYIDSGSDEYYYFAIEIVD